ncbi:MAG: hypothetical protein CGW95_03255 [Phenylobacterium zucineum]|nr:MAG: hypothetical protein CGW95_03255 [Phenylobacterium zucineum]
MRPFRLALCALIVTAGSASAQEVDPIGDLLSGPSKPPIIPSAPDPVPPPPFGSSSEPALAAPGPTPDTPVHIDELGRTPDTPPTPSDLNYESRLRATYNAAQGLQGPLDGRWILRSDGAEVYDLQLVDKGRGPLEGAWRDPRRPGAVAASGFVEDIQNPPGRLILRFKVRRDRSESVEVNLETGPRGEWSGEITEHGARRPAVLSRN